MKHTFICVAITLASWLLPVESFAQVDVGVSGSALISFQRIDDTYVGGPYLNAGIGGFAPGVAGALNVVLNNGVVMAGEFSTARFEQEQGGRLVPGSCDCPANQQSSVGSSGTTRLHDSMFSALIGYAKRRPKTQASFLIGAAVLLDNPTVDARFGEHFDIEGDEGRRVSITGGFDIRHDLSTRLALVFGGRYAFFPRDTSQQYLGIGSNVLRGSAGIRIRLN